MTETLRSRTFWMVALIVTQLVQGVVQQELRVEPLQTAVAEQGEALTASWQWRLLFCQERPENALYAPISHEPGQACRPAGEFCAWDSECCSQACENWRCQ